MYAFLDLRTRLFIQKEPDEGDQEKQRAQLERQLVRMAKSCTEAIITVMHMDDITEATDWVSPVIIGPRGGAAQISPAVPAQAVDPLPAMKKLADALPKKLWELQNEYTSKVTALHKEFLAACKAALSGKGETAAKPATVQVAGYDKTGAWLDVGEIVKEKKKK